MKNGETLVLEAADFAGPSAPSLSVLAALRFAEVCCLAPRRCLQGIHYFVQLKDGVERTKGVL